MTSNKKLFDPYGEPIEKIFKQFKSDNPINIYSKDLLGRYIALNDYILEFTATQEDQFLGRNDFDLLDHPTAMLYRKNDRQTISNNRPTLYVESTETPNILSHHSISLKTPIKNSAGHNAGILGISLPILPNHTFNIAQLVKYIDNTDHLTLIQSANALAALNRKGISQREAQTLFYFIRYKSPKPIANKIQNISCRTIEEHIIHCREKLSMHSTQELLSYLWEINFNYLTLNVIDIFFKKIQSS
jgi:hypothetical protein